MKNDEYPASMVQQLNAELTLVRAALRSSTEHCAELCQKVDMLTLQIGVMAQKLANAKRERERPESMNKASARRLRDTFEPFSGDCPICAVKFFNHGCPHSIDDVLQFLDKIIAGKRRKVK